MDLIKFPFFTTIICPLLVIQQQVLSAPVCKDLNSKCSNYARHCTVYDHIKKQCPLTCNLCGAINPTSPVTSTTSSHLMYSTRQSTAVASQSPTVTLQSAVPIYRATSQSLTPTQSTASKCPVDTQTQSDVSISQVTPESQSLTSTQSTASIYPVVTKTQSSVDLSQGLLNSPPTLNTDVLLSSSVGLNNLKTQTFVRASASKTKLTQAKLLITLGMLCIYLLYWC